jgi:23S rRNA (cytidine1920-2'-O)/16S rRNA (cytidine1409-2'-O)-methyltransferase
MERADITLVNLGLAISRSQATLLIKEGVVYWNEVPVKKASQKVTEETLEVRKDVHYVGRGAHKIEGALKQFDISVNDLVVADVGASTGGFTDYVLRNGASKVYAIDVGHDQLAAPLREDPRVINLEGKNIRYPLELEEKVDLAVVDLSYISLRLTLESIFLLVKDGGEIVTLFKPQFEAGKERVPRTGIVKDEIREIVLEEFCKWCEEQNYKIVDQMVSPIKGKTGNLEYLLYFQKD